MYILLNQSQKITQPELYCCHYYLSFPSAISCSLLSWYIDYFYSLLRFALSSKKKKKSLTTTSRILISSSYNHFLSNLNNLPYLIGICLFISNLHPPFNIWNCSLVPFLPNYKGQMRLSLVTVIATAPHHPRNQHRWHVCANMTTAEWSVTERFHGSNSPWFEPGNWFPGPWKQLWWSRQAI